MNPDRKRQPSAPRAAATALLLTGVAVGALALANALIFYRTPPLETALEEGDVRYYPTTNGDIFYQVAGDGAPLLLVHGIGAGESSYEFRRIFAALAATGRRVYAIDLIGFGKSDKPDLDYDAETYIALLQNFLADVVQPSTTPARPVDILASSLSGAYAVALADRRPDLVGRLVLVGPTGLESLSTPPNPTGALLRGLLRTPVLGPALYNAVASRAFIRAYLPQMIYRDPSLVTDSVVERYHASAHQPGGDRVLPSFMTGFLNQNIADAWGRLPNPTLLVWGADARQTPLARAQAFVDANTNARLVAIAGAGSLPHDEQPVAFLDAVLPFLQRV